MATVYSYRRCSSKRQLAGDSISRQDRLAKAWLAANPDHHLDTTLRLSEAMSGKSGKNLSEKGLLGQFIKLVRQGAIAKGSILMLESIDRFSRMAPRKIYSLFSDVVEAGIKVLTLRPEMMIDESNIDDTAVVIGLILGMQLAFDENKKASSAEFVGEFRLGEGAKGVI